MKRLMANIAAFGMVGCIVLVMAGCGGSDSVKEELAQTQEQLAAAEEERKKAEAAAAAAEEERKKAEAEAAAAEEEKKKAEEAAAAAEEERKKAEEEKKKAEEAAAAAEEEKKKAEEEKTAAEQQEQQAREDAQKAQEQAQSLEASQRAKNLLAAFPTIGATPSAPTGNSPVTMTVPSKGSLKFAQTGRSVSSISTPGLTGERGARLTRTRGGTDTTVVYTDRELSRKLLDHYAQFKPSADAKQLQIDASGSPPAALLVNSVNFIPRTDLKVTHNFSSKISSTATERAPTKVKASFSGSLHGISGQFLCDGAEGCMITLTSAYNASDATTDPNELNSVLMTVGAPSGTPALYFKPDSASATVSLGPTGIQGVVADDGQYMTFGWWGHEPASVNGTYTFGVFSDVTGTVIDDISGVGSGVTGTADYDGTAVGLYVDQDATTARQGEFTAEVRLTADFDNDSLSGEIDTFKTTPRGGSTAPALSDDWAVVLANDGAATIRRTGSTSSGAWAYDFVSNHQYARENAKPPAVTGTFNTQITNLLQIVGAFGAELQQ